jgi:hypothetical protein
MLNSGSAIKEASAELVKVSDMLRKQRERDRKDPRISNLANLDTFTTYFM